MTVKKTEEVKEKNNHKSKRKKEIGVGTRRSTVLTKANNQVIRGSGEVYNSIEPIEYDYDLQ